MKNLILLILFPGLAMFSVAQDGIRYRDLIFKSSTRQKNIVYDSSTTNVRRHRLDIYTPAGDTVTHRPVIMLLHGGGFKFGSKNNSRMKIWGRRFARMGYVCLAMNYTLSQKKPLSRFRDLAGACLVATGDVYTAKLWLRRNINTLGVDADRIILAGHSAGAMIALQTVYADSRDLQALADPGGAMPAHDGFPTVNLHLPADQREGIVGIINFWGAVYDTTWLTGAKVPIVSVHGSKDRIVPFGYGEASVFGSSVIHRVADREGISNALKTYEGLGHELQKHFNPIYAGPVARKRWREAADFAADFLYVELFTHLKKGQ